MNKKLLTVIISVIALIAILVLVFTTGLIQQNEHYNLEYAIKDGYIDVTDNQPFPVTVFFVFTNSTSGKTYTLQGPNIVPHQEIDEWLGTSSDPIYSAYGTSVKPNAPTPSPMGFMGNAEQASITNVVFNSNTQLTVTIQNTGSTNVTINTATIDGNTATMNPLTLTVTEGNTGAVTITSATAFVNSAQYTITLTTAKGNSIVYTATYSEP